MLTAARIVSLGRHQRPHRVRVGLLPPREEQLAEAPGDRAEDHVVHRAAERMADAELAAERKKLPVGEVVQVYSIRL